MENFKIGDEVIGINGYFNGIKGVITDIPNNFNIEVKFTNENWLIILKTEIKKYLNCKK